MPIHKQPGNEINRVETASEVDDSAHVSLDIVTTPTSIEEQEEEKTTRHCYKTAVPPVFNASNQPERDRENEIKSRIAYLRDIRPMPYTDYEGKEHSLLAAPKLCPKKERQPLKMIHSKFLPLPSAIPFWINSPTGPIFYSGARSFYLTWPCSGYSVFL
ncbi:hypothetical protein PHYBLDRAFT_138380 [Phycomyces blakesleeanus NRRL 1555(-)]|uniref:Uncharacterized protein n=1 Tax=Phycomyces blakesleeanus (strain ATCC 8743b / DSM 1359 / FGSC 10004 / NBRC 33097 / NRRL 1555) TaxID=763407 RepID=A0A163EQD8_PHYB8|nr:hypothetical protein PHYBLDRAFT_138380 [Phycomyces blakesleeanus NRRL 1555(-)]OAD80830.1 hypothetical protein PHYBLDRAFT_138380 [Phycomyces blakesleeanus NRRL 1555(-)]|eukprot:XP_018298870.1 hypothetical protein PHYBLDRAFT_138380 [Phycomyces blakesleeanus NRRL 1555(-)]